jgi:hypothetical protein
MNNERPPSSKRFKMLRNDTAPVSGAELRVLAAIHGLDVRLTRLETIAKLIGGSTALISIGLQLWQLLK